jgi:hypothetical protein
VVPIYFLNRNDLWNTVKPYNFHYFPKENFPLYNHQRTTHNTDVRSMRPVAETLSLDKQGFEVYQLDTDLTYSQIKDEEGIQNVYLRS